MRGHVRVQLRRHSDLAQSLQRLVKLDPAKVQVYHCRSSTMERARDIPRILVFLSDVD
jgi:hypothetical protein